ncbi:Uncharacterised protein [Streptococcus pneumoniae]|nr:Uncharacterised protein [Streptococcus pneumoniae]
MVCFFSFYNFFENLFKPRQFRLAVVMGSTSSKISSNHVSFIYNLKTVF